MSEFNKLFPEILLAYIADVGCELSNARCNELSKYVSGLELRAEQAEAYIKKLEHNIPENNLALAQTSLRAEKAEAEITRLKESIAELEYYVNEDYPHRIELAKELIEKLQTRIAELSSAAPVQHPASDPPKHPNWVIVCIEGEVLSAEYLDGIWWGDDEPLPTPEWWCELPYKEFQND